MFTNEEIQSIIAEASAGLPLSVSAAPENLTDGQKKILRGVLVAILKGVFTSITKIPLPVQQADGPESLLTAPVPTDLIVALIKPALSFGAEHFGDAILAAVLAHKDEVNKFAGDPVYDLAGRIIRELRGSGLVD